MAVLMEIQEFVSGRHKQLVDTNNSLRARALHTMVTELDVMVTNTWMNADTEKELFTRSSWSNHEDSLTRVDFADAGLRLVQDGSQSGSCCPFVETENEIHVEERYEPAWLGARRSVAQCGCRDAGGLGELECDGTFAYGNGDGSQKSGNQRDVCDRSGTQITPAENEENRTAP